MRIFGPIPSRRLGQSLGINNIPPKVCTYSCVYCQMGRTKKMQHERAEFYNPETLFEEAREKIENLKKAGESIDFITFVSDGEPTLDINLGKEIELLKSFGVKIAIITNASLLWMEDVRLDLIDADLVSIKIDSVEEKIWRQIDRPHGYLNIQKILEGIQEFAKVFKGTLATETMLVDGINDNESSIEKTAEFISKLKPTKPYILVPTRPPGEDWVRQPKKVTIEKACQIFRDKITSPVICMADDEENKFFVDKNIAEDLLSITSVHPMKEEVIKQLLNEKNSDWSLVQNMIDNNLLEEMVFQGLKFYKRKTK